MTATKSGKLPLLLIFLTVFIDLIGFGIIIPILPTYAEKFSADPLTVGLLLMSYSLMQFFFTPIWGRLSDNVGRRPILLLSLAASALGYLIWGFAGSLTMLFVSRVVAGTGNANIAVAQAYIADITTPENRAKGMGLIGAAFGLGFVLGPAIGGLCAHFGGVQIVGFVAAGFSLVDLVLTYFCLPEPEKRSRAGHDRFQLEPSFYARTLTSPQLRVPMLIFFISTFAFSNMEATLVLLTEKRFSFNQADNSWMFTFIGFILVMVQGGMIGRLSRKYGEKALIIAGTFIVATGLVLTGESASVGMLYFAVALLALGSGINTPSNQSILSKLSDPAEVGGVMGVGQSLSTLGRILGPVAGGAAFQYFGQSSPYYIGAACMLIACLLSFALPKAPEPQPVQPEIIAVENETKTQPGEEKSPISSRS
jgi:MFS transporter, DHA1 family, tetracycline resistance protein